MSQLVQITGALLILAGFALSQAGRLSPQGLPYLTLNLVGSAILALLALEQRQWGFLLLEGVWAIVSLASLIREIKDRATPGERRASDFS